MDRAGVGGAGDGGGLLRCRPDDSDCNACGRTDSQTRSGPVGTSGGEAAARYDERCLSKAGGGACAEADVAGRGAEGVTATTAGAGVDPRSGCDSGGAGGSGTAVEEHSASG